MLSRSAVVKLKAILVIDLIIVSAAAGAYFYFQGQGLIASAAQPAKFTLTDLTIDPLEAYVGEAVLISVNVSNIGDLEGNLTVNLIINDAITETTNITMMEGNSSQVLRFNEIETVEGTYNVRIGELNGTFTIKPAPPDASKIILSDLLVNPYELWENDSFILTATAKNPSADPDNLTVKATIDDVVVATRVISLAGGSTQPVNINLTATGGEGDHIVKMNTLSGYYTIVKTGYHTLTINRNGGGSIPLPFTLNGDEHNTPFTALMPVGEYKVSVPTPFSTGTGVLVFASWSDGVNKNPRSFTLDSRLILIVSYTLISGYASCPSLYVWNGSGYSYVTDVSNSGWLGYIGQITSSGDVVFSGGNLWDYVKLDRNMVATKDVGGTSSIEMVLSQQWDELFYLDAASLVVVDHPAGTDAYSSLTYYLNKGQSGQIYTVNTTDTRSPVAATDGNGQNVLPDILKADGVYTPSTNVILSPSWDNMTINHLTLDLGNLSDAQQIKLVMTGIVDWGSYQTYYNWINTLKSAAAQRLLPNGTEVTPPSYLEIKAANGSWVMAPQDRQMPIPSDSNPRTFVVDLTGLFPAGLSDYQIRISNSWNVTYDYIGIDTSTQQNMTVQTISPTATLSQFWETNSTSSGNFTRYGDVTPLLQSADDMYVIGRQGDQVKMEFSTANLTAPASGMVRDYFLYVACWFKDPPGNWGYEFSWSVDPMPFMNMSGFPYTTAESYPFDAAHLAYLQQYNTRVINAPAA